MCSAKVTAGPESAGGGAAQIVVVVTASANRARMGCPQFHYRGTGPQHVESVPAKNQIRIRARGGSQESPQRRELVAEDFDQRLGVKDAKGPLLELVLCRLTNASLN